MKPKPLSYAMALMAAPAAASACGACVFSVMETRFPPVLPWSVIGFLAYVAVCGLARPRGHRVLVYLFHPLAGVPVAIVASVLLSGMGPLPFLVMLIMAFVGLAARWKETRAPRVAVIAALVGIAMGVTAVTSTIQVRGRDDVAFILRWQGTAGSKWRLEALEKAKDLAAIRKLVREEGFESAQAALALARIGKAKQDGPILVDALRRQELADANDSYQLATYSEALEKLLGGKPATGTKATDWDAMVAALP